MLTKRSVLFVISDFIDVGYLPTMRRVNRRHDVVAAKVTDPAEGTLPSVGLVELRDAETGRRVLVDTAAVDLRKQLPELAHKRHEMLQKELRGSGIDLISLDTSEPTIGPLLSFSAHAGTETASMRVILLWLSLLACDAVPEKAEPEGLGQSTSESTSAEDSVEQIREEGPIRLSLTLTPAKTRLGDLLTLDLQAETKAGVSVTMPAFGEALGRFEIIEFAPRSETASDGSRMERQTYTLQAPMSGLQRIPSLRILYQDQRDGQDGEERELLTDEIPIDVHGMTYPYSTQDSDGNACFCPSSDCRIDVDGDGGSDCRDRSDAVCVPVDSADDGLADTCEADLGFRNQKGQMTERDLPRDGITWWWLGLVPVVLAGMGWIWFRKFRQDLRQKSAYEQAIHQLAELEMAGMEHGDSADEFFARLSMIVRRYIEGRYGLQAPEQTTEEFLSVAASSSDISDAHQGFLSAFLARCDQIKLLKWRPARKRDRNKSHRFADF